MGNPFQNTDRAVPASIQRNLERKYHLDKPWYLQHLWYVEGVITFDLGPSLVQRNRDVNDVIKEHFPVSLKLGCLAMLWAVLLGIPLGVISALKQNTIVDYVTMVLVNLGYAIPNFLICTLLIYFFAVKSGDITGFPTNGIQFGWKSWILPAIALGHAPMTLFARIVRGSMLETLRAGLRPHRDGEGPPPPPRRRPARAAQLADPGRHSRRAPARVPDHRLLHRRVHLRDPGDRAGYFVISVTGRDYSVTMGITIMLSLIIIFANMVVDILYGFLDPRTRDVRT